MLLLEPYHLVAQFLALWGKKSLLPEFHEPRGVLAVEAVGGLVTRTVASVMGYIEWLEAFRSRGVEDFRGDVRMVNSCREVRVLLYQLLGNLSAAARAYKAESKCHGGYCRSGHQFAHRQI